MTMYTGRYFFPDTVYIRKNEKLNSGHNIENKVTYTPI